MVIKTSIFAVSFLASSLIYSSQVNRSTNAFTIRKLNSALTKKKFEKADTIIKSNPGILQSNGNGQVLPLLFQFVFNGNDDAIKFILKHDPLTVLQIDRKNSGNIPLFYALRINPKATANGLTAALDRIRLLLEHSPQEQLSTKNCAGETPLMRAQKCYESSPHKEFYGKVIELMHQKGTQLQSKL